MKRFFSILVPFLAACSSDNNKSDAGDSGAIDSGSKDTGTMDTSTMDTGSALNGCKETDFVDMSGPTAMRNITWTFNPTPACIQIAPGQSVSWSTVGMADFGTHPLQPFGGDTNNPIMPTSTGMMVSFAFPNAGNFGFHCGVHASMEGVVRVK